MPLDAVCRQGSREREPCGSAQGHTRAPLKVLPLGYQGKNLKWTGKLFELQLFDAVLCCGGLRWVFLRRLGSSISSYSLEWCAWWRDLESSVSCCGGHGAASATRLWACSNTPVAFAWTWDLCKPNTSFAAGLWPMQRLGPKLPCRAALEWGWFFSEWESLLGEPQITYTPSARPQALP